MEDVSRKVFWPSRRSATVYNTVEPLNVDTPEISTPLSQMWTLSFHIFQCDRD